MATVEKEMVEYAPVSPHQRLRWGSVLGTIFVLGSIWLILAGLPWFWTEAVALENVFLSWALLIFLEIAGVIGLFLLGRQLEGSNPPHGLRAGIFVLSMWVLATIFLCYRIAWGIGEYNQTASATVTFVLFGASMVLAFLVFRKEAFCQWLGRVEDTGWFHANGYKSNQGLRVRRCTVVALLILGGCGIFVYAPRAAREWKLTIPFLGEPGAYLGVTYEDSKTPAGIRIKEVEPRSPAAREGLKPGDVLTHVDDDQKVLTSAAMSTLLSEREGGRGIKLTGTRPQEGVDQPLKVDVVLASAHPAVPLLYQPTLMVPLLLVAVLVWVSWRVVNMPAFADFLIATEAEMNKVSWTTPQRLKQDTIVVLVTVVILSLFLFVIDIMWINVLGSDLIGVLRVDVRAEVQKQQEKTQW